MKISYSVRYNIRLILGALTIISVIAIIALALIGGVYLILTGIAIFIAMTTGANTFLGMLIASSYIAAGIIAFIMAIVAIIVLLSGLAK